ncbi:MAG: alpha/beta fold hydrolase [Paracoccaceae bacterium]
MAKRVLFLCLMTAIGLAVIHLTAGIREKRAEGQYPAPGRLIELDGVKIHAEQFGEGPDLILLHGASGTTREFTFSLVEKLSDQYRVTVFDRPGLGWSRQPEGFGGAWNSAGESPSLQANILRQAADELGIVNPLILGHSFGGAVALSWALDNPDTAGLILLGAVSHPWPGELDWTYRINASPAGGALFVPFLSAFVPSSYVNGIIDTIFEPQAVPDGYVDHIGPGLTLRRKTIRANARQVNGVRPHVVKMADKYPTLKLPIEIVHGDLDTIVPLSVHSIPLAERVDSAVLTVLEGVGHMPHHADEAATLAAIERAAQRAGLR